MSFRRSNAPIKRESATEEEEEEEEEEALISQIYFWNKPLHVSDSFSVHHQEIFTVHSVLFQK